MFLPYNFERPSATSTEMKMVTELPTNTESFIRITQRIRWFCKL